MAMSQLQRNLKKKLVLCVEPMFHLQDTIATLTTYTNASANKTTSGLRPEETHGSGSGDFNYYSYDVGTKTNVKRLCKQGRLKEAIDILFAMDQRGSLPDINTYGSLLEGCINAKALPQGKLLHAHLIHSGFNPHIFLRTKLVIMYAKCGNLGDARRVVDEMPEPNVVLWNVMIAAYARHGRHEDALTLFYQMQHTGTQPDHFTFSSILSACANLAALDHGKKIHEDILNGPLPPNIFVRNALVDMYAKCGRIEDARQVFDNMPERDVVSWTSMVAGYSRNGDVEEALKFFQQMPEQNVISWNAMIAGYTQNGDVNEALSLFQKMPERNAASWTSMIAGYSHTGGVDEALKLFQKMPHQDLVSWNAMIAGYAQNGHVGEALNLFQKMSQRDIFSWNAMMAGYAQNGYVDEAVKLFEKMPEIYVISWNSMIAGYAQKGNVDESLKLFQKMPKRDMISWNVITAGCAQNGHLDGALKLFQIMPERDLVSWTSMIAGYAQKGHVDEAQKLFQKMPERDVVSWTAMISAYTQNGHFDEALKIFKQMQLTGARPVSDIFSSILPACANLSALKQGKEVHGNIIRRGYQFRIFVGSALIDMYAKCGSIEDAFQVFGKLPEQNVISWNAMIVGYAMHGCGKEALGLFEQMQQSGMKPDHVTFVGVLSACCHSGLVDNGWQYFDCMSRDYNITPTEEHYACMVDLLGRAGCLDEVQIFINKMPIKPGAAVWGSLLGACRIYNNIELGECAAEHLFELEPENAANYVLLSNMYAAAGRWDDVENVQKLRIERKTKKSPGCSWIEVNNKVYSFLVRDRSHPETHEIYSELERLTGLMKEAGYVPDRNLAMHDVEEEQKEHVLCHHSEKLAIAFGLIHTYPGKPIQIIKNLRVCGDCHSATKFISKIVAREIVVRDANRFHHFKDGQCSCRDYW